MSEGRSIDVGKLDAYKNMSNAQIGDVIYRNMNDPNKLTEGLFFALRKEVEEIKPRIPEHVFVNVFLPFFAKLPSADPRVNLGTWVNYLSRFVDQKAHLAEVIIVDENGTELYTVPPVASARLMNPTDKEGGSRLYHMIQLAARRKDINPAKADQVLQEVVNYFDFKSPFMSEIAKQYEERWIKIFQRYSILPENLNTLIQNKPTDDGNDIFEF